MTKALIIGGGVAGPVGVRWRGGDLVMPAVLKRFASEKTHEWMYRYHIDWDEKVG